MQSTDKNLVKNHQSTPNARQMFHLKPQPLPESVCVDLRSDYIKSPHTPPNQPRIRPHTFCVDFRSGSRTGPSHGELCRDFSWKLVGYRLLLMSFYFHLISERFEVHPTEYK